MDKPSLSELRESCRLWITDKFDAPPVMLRIEESVVGTLGNFSASTGKAKSKKTFNICAIAAAALINGKVLNYRATLPDGKRNILYVDTEQSPYHCKKVLGRILRLSGATDEHHPETLEFLAMRRYEPKMRLSIIEESIYHTDGLGLVIIDGIRDLAYDINSPGEATDLITKMMRWTDERQIHIHTVLHLNKGDDNTRGHLGTELNNKAETVLQITKDDMDKDMSSVASMYIRDIDFEPFAFRINEDGLPELVDDYVPKQSGTSKGFDYGDVPEAKHREALECLFAASDTITYKNLISQIRDAYSKMGYSFGFNKAKELKVFLENKRMIVKENKVYRFNADFVF
jgi:hypothetical protein